MDVDPGVALDVDPGVAREGLDVDGVPAPPPGPARSRSLWSPASGSEDGAPAPAPAPPVAADASDDTRAVKVGLVAARTSEDSDAAPTGSAPQSSTNTKLCTKTTPLAWLEHPH